MCEGNCFKGAKKTKHLQRKKMAGKWERELYALLWLVGIWPFMFLLRNVSAIKLRGHGCAGQEIDGVWRWGGGAPGRRSLNPSGSIT